MTTSLTVFDNLALHPLIADFPARWLHRLAACGTPARWPASTRLLREGHPGDQLWLISAGLVQLDFHVPGGDVPIERIGGGDVVGWSCLVPPFRSTVGAFVVEDCHTIELRAGAVRELIAEDPMFGLAFTNRILAVAQRRLRTARGRVADLCAARSPILTPEGTRA
ncbi:Crp/Fnr family transcriptional regulator [Actinoplanes sp. NPDC049596]|uniref:Crp/Fnr family transcriptional regulator n=1 Tax=unclassified Actinoplanes TaxID=2626549 RepID=UPI003421FAA9